MYQSKTTPGSAARHFQHPPEHIAREVTKDWQAEHPHWTEDDLLFAYEYLLDIYRQAHAWWDLHSEASEADGRREGSPIPGLPSPARGPSHIITPGSVQSPGPLLGAKRKVANDRFYDRLIGPDPEDESAESAPHLSILP